MSDSRRISGEPVPGPYEIARYDEDKTWAIIETVERGVDLPDQGYAIAIVYDHPGCPTANLVALSWDLLQALENLMVAGESGTTVQWVQAMKEARALIARAKGGE